MYDLNEDAHKETAILLYGKKTITPKEQEKAKVVNFSRFYGAATKSLKELLRQSNG